jgi:hypothetical protein
LVFASLPLTCPLPPRLDPSIIEFILDKLQKREILALKAVCDASRQKLTPLMLACAHKMDAVVDLIHDYVFRSVDTHPEVRTTPKETIWMRWRARIIKK